MNKKQRYADQYDDDFYVDEDFSHEIQKIDQEIESLNAKVNRFGFDSWETECVQKEVRNLRSRRKKLVNR